jgi:mannose-6-phosphate isomerase-like protein (cupin superfamily)
MSAPFKVAIADAYRAVPSADGKAFAELFTHGSLAVEIYAPREIDRQQAHTRDEVYIIAQGIGEFVTGEFVTQAGEKTNVQGSAQRVAFVPGDLLFVAAHVPHRFENFSDDFFTWVLFYGPEGGEKARLGVTK